MAGNNRTWPSNNTVILLLSLNIFAAVCTLLYLSSSVLNNTNRENSTFDATADDLNATIVQMDGSERILTQVKKKIVTQPSTHISHIHVILAGIIDDIKLEKEKCLPEDFHNKEKYRMPKSSSKTNKVSKVRETVAIYFAVGLLLTSLGADFFKVYKGQSNCTKAKPALSRAFSLADHNVLKHSRKESIRREKGR